MRKFIIPVIAILIFIAGIASLMVPVLPFGWLFISFAALLLTPYFKFMRDLIEWLAKKDRTGIVKKAGETASKLYRWADDFEHAEELESVIEESYKEKTGSDAPKP